MTVKLSIEELALIKELFREKKEKRKRKKAKKAKKAGKKGEIFPNEKQQFKGDLVSDNVVRYNFPNTGASVLSRDFQNNLGDLNNRFNNLIKDKPEKTEEFKSKYHEMANNLIDDVLDGKRNIRRNKEGSTTITDLIEKPKESSKPKMTRRKVEIIRSPRKNDGFGDFSRVAFTPRKIDQNIRPTMDITSYFKNLPNPQPKSQQFIPRGDNIDFSVGSFEGENAVDGMPDDGNDGVNPEFEQPEPDEFLEVVEDVEDVEDDKMSINVETGDFKPDENEDWGSDENDENEGNDGNDGNYEDQQTPTLQIKYKPQPQTNDQNDEYEKFFGKKKQRKTPKIGLIDDEDDEKSFTCPECGKTYASAGSLKRHQKSKH
jgi:hypothetical protein